ncbi:MAG TPA: hypothetical protein VG329_11540 [Candidatus Dormibacteraeota bacterium]|jgi:hypothetical protein|nr:hypothetical protein [Candidatus Dormibacteraeota bacterium]
MAGDDHGADVEPHLTEVEPVPSKHPDDEPITDPRAFAFLFLLFLLVLAVMYLTQGRG